MPDTVPVTLEVEPAVAAALADPRNRAAMSRLVSRVLRPRPGPSELAHASARTTKLYDRRGKQISLDEVERITL